MKALRTETRGGFFWCMMYVMLNLLNVSSSQPSLVSSIIYCTFLIRVIPFAGIRTWWHTIERRAIQGVTIILVGNKVEDEEQREISTNQGQEIADELGIRYFETSAKANQGVTDVFVQLAR
jgi:GTPase SAR1 family protein